MLKLTTAIALFLSSAFGQVVPSSIGKVIPITSIDVEILSDTRGVDLEVYLQGVMYNLKQNWHVVMPESAMSPVLKRGKVLIDFAVLKNGQISGIHYVESSGDMALDRAAYRGITATNPLSSLPSEFQGEHLVLRAIFRYNPVLIAISPERVEVPAGFSLQFNPVLNGSTNITWKIVGMCGSGEQTCGNVSENGLYTAPPAVPDHPTVFVKATAEADLGETVSAIVTIVPRGASR